MQTAEDGTESVENMTLMYLFEVAFVLKVGEVEWCFVSPEQWQAILDKVPEEKLAEILGSDREYNASNVRSLLRKGNELFEGFNTWLAFEFEVFNIYNMMDGM